MLSLRKDTDHEFQGRTDKTPNALGRCLDTYINDVFFRIAISGTMSDARRAIYEMMRQIWHPGISGNQMGQMYPDEDLRDQFERYHSRTEPLKYFNETIKNDLQKELSQIKGVFGCAVVGSLRVNCAVPTDSDIDGVIFVDTFLNAKKAEQIVDRICRAWGLKNEVNVVVLSHDNLSSIPIHEMAKYLAIWYSGEIVHVNHAFISQLGRLISRLKIYYEPNKLLEIMSQLSEYITESTQRDDRTRHKFEQRIEAPPPIAVNL